VIKDKAIEKANRKETNQIVPDLENSPKEGIVLAAGSTRAQLMENCKQKGIKNFRVLNKQELTDCLANIGDQKKIDLIVAGAVARWKAGWKANKEVVGVYSKFDKGVDDIPLPQQRLRRQINAGEWLFGSNSQGYTMAKRQIEDSTGL
jgi:hypothetical protein